MILKELSKIPMLKKTKNKKQNITTGESMAQLRNLQVNFKL